MKKMKGTGPIMVAAVLGIMIMSTAKAGPLENMQGVLIFLQKARLTTAVQAKSENLIKAKELLAVTPYDGGGHRAAALSLTVQAIGNVNNFKLEKADQQIDIAIVKVKHTMQAIKQETAAKAKQGNMK